ncbi:unnamed protein product [Diatraea saccharalis]|uniref:Major facilitator superfamily (MFS) profile domain-containing protein n=1 Tax=Diatraea saccharalis TaxID=40085 RepID=A0A9N9RE83_9NEOP|nr:unnamed protein product [Diatraea saccharalis]
MEKMEKKPTTWITPLQKQCWVSVGVALNMGQLGLIFGISSTLLPQLREPDSTITIDEEYGSWIAALPGITLILGNFTVPILMAKFGRKRANLSSIIVLGLAWCCLVFASNVAMLLAARSLHGIGMGMISTLGPVLVGEYTTPANRGVFLMFLSVSIAVGVLTVHAMGSYLNWKTVSIICICIGIIDSIIVLSSPESPSWLASQGRYDECKRTFRWLRGDTEEEELDKLINSNVLARQKDEDCSNKDTFVMKLKKDIVYITDTIKRREFYMPIVIMFHVYGLSQWSAVNIFCSYGVDLIHMVIGKDVDVPLILISLDFQRSVSTAVGLIIVKKVKRKTLMNLSVGLNLLAMTVTAGYVFLRNRDFLPYDSSYIGVALMHIHMFSIATGAMPLGFILAGELFPLQFKSLAGGISAVCLSLTVFVSIKTVPFFLNNLQLYGTFMLYVGLEIICLMMANVLLPETKDRTLQDIENEFKNKCVRPTT